MSFVRPFEMRAEICFEHHSRELSGNVVCVQFSFHSNENEDKHRRMWCEKCYVDCWVLCIVGSVCGDVSNTWTQSKIKRIELFIRLLLLSFKLHTLNFFIRYNDCTVGCWVRDVIMIRWWYDEKIKIAIAEKISIEHTTSLQFHNHPQLHLQSKCVVLNKKFACLSCFSSRHSIQAVIEITPSRKMRQILIYFDSFS